MKLILFEAEFLKNTGQSTLEGGKGGSGDETTAKKRRRFQRTITKQIKSSVFLRKKYKVTPSVCRTG